MMEKVQLNFHFLYAQQQLLNNLSVPYKVIFHSTSLVIWREHNQFNKSSIFSDKWLPVCSTRIQLMQLSKGKERAFKLKLKSTTWYKDSHSLYDYESTKITEDKHEFDPSTKGINFYRKKNSSEVKAVDCKSHALEVEDYEFIGHFEIEAFTPQRIKINLLNVSTYKDKSKTTNNEKQKTNQSVDSINQKEEEAYFIVGNKAPNEPQGYKLSPGMTLKLGRIEYYVSECFDGKAQVKKPLENSKALFNENILLFNYDPAIKRDNCKICLDEHNNEDNFLFNPCKCNGSCGSVHFECLTEWIRIKVKKEVVGGTQHYNFTKFECEVCKSQFPGYVEVANGSQKYLKEMIGVDKPTGNYLILQSACEKEKSIMVIQNTPEEGVKIGRGHECEIRITDISVSRKHAIIRNIKNDFFIFDNKSKFGTLVREEGMGFEIKKQAERKAIQVGRTILEFEVSK